MREERLLIQCDFLETGISAHLLLKYMRTRRIDFELSEHYFQYHIRLGQPVLETLRRNLKLSLECLYLDIWTERETKRTCGRLSFIVKSLSPVRILKPEMALEIDFPSAGK